MLLRSAHHGFSPEPTCDQDCLSPSLMHLDVGKVDHISHTHVPRIEAVQSNAPFADLSCTVHAAVVSSQGSSIKGKNEWPGGFGNQMCNCSLAPLMWRGPPPGLVGWRLLDTSQMKWAAPRSGTEARHAQTPTKIVGNCPICPISRPSFRRQAPVESEFLQEICSSVPDANGGVFFEKCDEFHKSQFAPRARTQKLSAHDIRKPSDPMPCLLLSSGGVEWSRQIKRGESVLAASLQ